MKFMTIRESGKVYDDSTLSKRIADNNKWKPWVSSGWKDGPGVESIFTPAEVTSACTYGDALVVNPDGSANIAGQKQIVIDAKAGKPEAMRYLFLIFQDVTLAKFWGQRIGSSKARRSMMGNDPEVWEDWLTIAWIDLTKQPHVSILYTCGKSALDGFDVNKSADFACLSNLANRYGFLLTNSAGHINDDERRHGMKGSPFMSSDDIDEETGKKVDNKPSVISYDPAYMDAKAENDQSAEIGPEDPTVDEAYERIYHSAAENEAFFAALKDALADPRSKQVGKDGMKLLTPLLYLIGEPLNQDSDGVYEYAKKWDDTFRNDESPRDRKAAIKLCKHDFPKQVLPDEGIEWEDFEKHVRNNDDNKRIRKMLKAALGL
jgi:hypothetical protein